MGRSVSYPRDNLSSHGFSHDTTFTGNQKNGFSVSIIILLL